MSMFSSLLKKALPIASGVAGLVPGIGWGVKAGLMGANGIFNAVSKEGKNIGSPGNGTPAPGAPGAPGSIEQAGGTAAGWAAGAAADQTGSRNHMLSLLNTGPTFSGGDAGSGAAAGSLQSTIAAGPRTTTLADAPAAQSRGDYQNTIDHGGEALNTTTRAAVAGAMPGFLQQLQGVNANAVRRGISTGDLGTSYEGDVASAFNRNIDNSVAGQASNLFGQQLNARGQIASMDQSRAEGDLNRAQATYGTNVGAQTNMYDTAMGAATARRGQDVSTYQSQLGGAENMYGTDAAQTSGARNTYLDLLSGNADRATAAANAAAQRRAGLLGAGMGALGQFAGTNAGQGLIGSIGGAVSGLFGGNNSNGPTLPSFNPTIGNIYSDPNGPNMQTTPTSQDPSDPYGLKKRSNAGLT